MKVQKWTSFLPGRAWVWILALCSLPLVCGSAASNSPPVPLQQQYDDLVAKILADPNWFQPANTPEIQKLEDLKKALQEQRSQILELLVAGLDDYRKGKLESARKRLLEAVRSPYVKDVARAALGDPNAISGILKTCSSPSDSKFCARCDRSGIYCCGPEAVGGRPGRVGRKTAGSEGCGGLGWIVCSDCGGRGKQLSANQFQRRETCQECRGKGCVGCDLCDGKGTKLCDCVIKLQKSANTADAQQSQEVDRLISLASHLSAGGIDLNAPGALRPAPVLP